MGIQDRHDHPVLSRPLALALAVLAAAAVAAAASAGSSLSLQQRLTRALALAGGQPVGALAVDLRTGDTVYAQAPDASLRPASNEKLPVSFAALTELGPSFRFRTEVLGEGRLDAGGVWTGNLVLKGYGDPTLTSAGLAELARQVRGAGITRVTGSLIADETWFDTVRAGPGWKPSFLLGESPALGALVVDRGRYAGRHTLRPGLAAGLLFRDALGRAGVAVPPRVLVVRGGGFPLAALWSPPLAEILRVMDTDSDNFIAELVAKELGAVLGPGGTTAAGVAVVSQTLAGADVPLAGVSIVDGSGLSMLDRLTPAAVVAILRAAYADPELRPFFVGALAIAGRTGTIDDRLRARPTRGRVFAKTGTTSLASALSGYVGDRYVFSIIHNGNPVRIAAAHAAQDRFVTVLAKTS